MRKLVLLIVAVLLMTVQAFAQSKQVTGTVVSADGQPLSGVTVVIKGTQTGVYTDGKGNFTINTPGDASLQLSLTGWEGQELRVGDKTHITATMEEDAYKIDDVYVTGYGTAKKAGTIIGSVDVIDSEKFAVKPSMNVMDALQGQVAGLNIMTSSGQPNATPSVRLHGIGSMSAGNEPLVILDGSAITLGTLMMMNQSDFESIVVLKDASATSIYGSRAANGVIYVVSKSGRRDSGERAIVTLRQQYSMSSAVRPKLKGLSTDAYVDYMLTVSPVMEAVGYGKLIDEATATTLRSYGNTDWFKEIFKENAPMIQTDLSVSGGGRKTSYYISGTYNDTKSVVRGADMKRYTFRSNIEVTPKDWLKTGMALSVGYSEMANTNNATSFGGVFPTFPAMGSFMIPSYQTPRDKDGNLYTNLPLAGNYPSPHYLARYFPNAQNRLQLNGALFVEVKPVKGLTLRSNLGVNAFDYRTSGGTLPDSFYNSSSGNMRESFQRLYEWTLTNTAEYTHSFNREHTFTILAGQESILNDSESFGVSMQGILDPNLMFISKGNALLGTPSHAFSQSTFNSLFGRAEYNYKERYFADVSVRNDGSSRFGTNNRHATFYAVGAMWNLKNENFLKNNTTFSRLALKASYGTQGNANIGNYNQYDTFGTTKYMGQMGWAQTGAENQDLTWEKQSKLTIGVNAELFSVVRVNVEFYNRKSEDMLMSIPNFAATGFSSKMMNVGDMKNTGVDLTINADLFKNKDWYVNVSTTFNYNRNKITKLFNGLQEIPSVGGLYMMVGESIETYKMYEWRGVNSDTGEPQWTGAGGVITNNYAEAELVNLKKSMYAPYLGGVSFVATWKDLTLSADMSWQAGRWMVNNNIMFSENIMNIGGFNQTEDALDYWKKPGDKARYPSLEAQLKGSMQFDTHTLENASFIRLKNLQLTYSIPKKIIQKTRIFEGIKVWVGARNLLTWTNFRGLDPEVDSNISLDNYPNTRQITFGIEVQF